MHKLSTPTSTARGADEDPQGRLTSKTRRGPMEGNLMTFVHELELAKTSGGLRTTGEEHREIDTIARSCLRGVGQPGHFCTKETTCVHSRRGLHFFFETHKWFDYRHRSSLPSSLGTRCPHVVVSSTPAVCTKRKSLRRFWTAGGTEVPQAEGIERGLVSP